MKSKFLTVCAAGLILAGCDGTGNLNDKVDSQELPDGAVELDSSEPRNEAAQTLIGGQDTSSQTTSAADEAAARTFVSSVFDGYVGDGSIDLFGNPGKYFDPELAGAIAALGAQSERTGEMHDALSADPICGCQDYGDFKYTINSLTVDGTRAVAKVGISNFGSPDTRTLELAKTAQGWRVYNIDGSFRGLVF